MAEGARRLAPAARGGSETIHLAALSAELDWFAAALDARLRSFLGGEAARSPRAPRLAPESGIGALSARCALDEADRLILALAAAAALRPALLDPLMVRNSAIERPFTEFGGALGPQGGFRPTGETALFLLGAEDVAARVAAARRLGPEGALRSHGLVDLGEPPPGAGVEAGALTLTPETLGMLSAGRPGRPDLSPGFPARRLETDLGWDDLVLAPEVADQIEQILGWVTHERRIREDWGLGRALTPGYRALFCGPPGTGKTLTAALLGQRVGADVYRIDLSMVVSKYIGETEKNLAAVFDRAERGDWILFFDEADALFGARTATSDAHDRYANQEIAYLLQRIEACGCLAILSSNLRGNIDDAFSRRFQSLVTFRRPDAEERLRLWRGALAHGAPLDGDVDLAALARDHELTGGAIVNVIRHAAVLALRRERAAMSRADLLAGIAAEMRKEGRTP
jgi:hypothetical protein